MSLSAPFIARPVATTLLNLSIVLAGAVAFLQLPVSPLPQVDFPVIAVSANLPGASPETMASSVATPLERSLGIIAGVNEIRSFSSQGSTRVMIQFDLGKDINGAAREVQAAINASRSLLPSALPGMPSYRKMNPSQAPIMILALTSDTKPTSEIYDLASTVLAQKVAQVTGVGDVTVGGGSLPAVRVELEPNALTQYGISLDDVRRTIATANLLRPKGTVEEGQRSWQIKASDQLTHADEYKPLIVAQRNGASVRLSDVANVYDGVQDRYNSGFFNNKPAVLLIVSRQPDANIIETVNAIQAQMPALRGFLPAGVDLAVASDRSPGIRATLHEAERTLLIAVALVILVVLLFLASFRASIIPVAAVPVALIGSFGVMYLWGFSLNNLSLMALIVATGLVVDDAIVVLENISRHVELGKSPFEAAVIGAKEVGWTLLSMNLALVAVFISILFMGGIVERLFREFSITLVAAILISLMVSLTLTPMLCARWLRAREHETKRNVFQRISDRGFRGLLSGYDRSLGWALRHAPLVVCLLLGVMALNVSLYIAAPKSFLPNQDTGQLGGFIRGDDGTSFQVMQPKIQAFRRAVLTDPAVESVAGFIGGGGFGGGINNAQTFVRLKPLRERKIGAQEVVERINRSLPHIPGARMRLFVDQDIRFGGRGQGGGGYEYMLLADDSNLLRVWAERVKVALEVLPGVDRIRRRTALEPAGHAVDRPRRGQAPRRRDGDRHAGAQQRVRPAAGLDHLQRAQPVPRRDGGRAQVRAGPGGPRPRVRHGRRPARATVSVQQVRAHDRQGPRQPLGAIRIAEHLVRDQARREHDPGAGRDRRRRRPACDAVGGPGQAPGERGVLPDHAEQPAVGCPGHAADRLHRPRRAVQSYMHPLTILSTLPSAGVGALLALQALKTEFSLIAMLGLFLLVGVVMKNAILMIDVALQLERENGLAPDVAIRQACLLRLRPILMTTMAAMLGTMPLMIGAGEGSELRKPLGIAIVGGLAFSQILTLYTTPVVYLYLDRLRLWAGRRRRSAVEAHA